MVRGHSVDEPIENYGIIGDLKTTALVSLHGSIDFMCAPHFDSPSIFAALLDRRKGGFYEIRPAAANISTKQQYLPETNILLTRFLLEDGFGEMRDYMPLYPNANLLIRTLVSIKGEITYRLRCCPRFNYARSEHHTHRVMDGVIFSTPDLEVKLISPVPLKITHGDAYAEFTLKVGEEISFIVCFGDHSSLPPFNKAFIEQLFESTFQYWKNWTAKSTYNGRWREMVTRSALLLKLLISDQYGSIIAAPTFSLPEKIGGGKNWDYRFAWIRDSAFTVYSLMLLGYKEEADAFRKWIECLCEKLGAGNFLQPFYRFNGQVLPPETELDFEGYRGSKPVRIGNAASHQFQIDIYGEFIDALYIYTTSGGLISHDTWQRLTQQVSWMLQHWKKKDYGIWESRGRKMAFLYSRFMCWVAVDRAIKIAQSRSLPFPSHWEKERNLIYHSVFNDFWDDKKQAFVQSKSSKVLDASALLMPLIRFISPRDPRWLSTLKCIEEELVTDCLVYRYPPDKAALFGLKEGEGTFTACSFWYIECLSRAGELRKAELLFDKTLSYANHLGLFSEQLGPQGEQLGNFPQAFTHLALISAAFDLNKRLSR